MVIAYKNTPEDIAAWYRYHWNHTSEGRRSVRRQRFRYSLAFALFSVAIRFLAVTFGWSPSHSLTGYVSVALISFCVYFALSVQSWKQECVKQSHAAVAKQTSRGELDSFLYSVSLEPLPEGMRTVWQGGTSIRNWTELKQISQTESHIVFHYGGNDYMLIPNRAFQDAEGRSAFIAATEHFRSGVVSVPALTTVGQTGTQVGTAGAPWWRDRYNVDTGDDKTNLRQHR